MPKYLPLPDGSFYKVDDDVSYDAALTEARSKFPKAFGLEKKGVGAALGKGIESLISSGYTGLQAVTGSPEEAAALGLQRQQALEQQYANEVGLDLVKQKYEKEGLGAAAKEVGRQIPLALAEQAPNIGASIATGRVGARLGRAAGPWGSLVGGLAGAAAPSLVQQFGGNIERQAAEGQPVDIGAAGAAAVPQAALDVAGTFIPFGRTLVGKAFGKDVAAALQRGATKSAEKLAEESLKKSLAKGLGVGAIAEIPTEVAQQMLERAQAGLSLTSEDALAEYGDTAYQVGLLAPIGSVGRVVDRGGARKDIAEKKAKEEADRYAAAEQARLASPEYYNSLVDEQQRIQEQIANMQYGLGRAKKESGKAKLQGKIDTAQEQLNEVQAKLAAHPLHAERQAKATEQEQTAKTMGMFGEWQQQAQADEAQRQANAAQGIPSNVPSLPGMEQPYTPVETAQPAAIPLEDLRQQHAALKGRLDTLEQEKATAAVQGNTSVIASLDNEIRKIQGGYAEAERMLKEHPDVRLEALTKKLADAGEKGDFETISKLAAQIEELKTQGAATPTIPTYNQQQEPLLGPRGAPSTLAAATVKAGEKQVAEKQKAATEGALEQEQADLLGLGYTKPYKMTPEERVAKGVEGFKQSMDQLEEEYAKTADERAVSRLVDLFQKGGAKEEASADIADRTLQPQQNKFRSGEAKGDADEAFMRFSESLGNLASGTYLGGKNTAAASSSKAGLLKKAEQAKRDYIEAVLQQVDNDRLANRHNSLTQGQALQLAMQIHTAMDRNLKAGTVEPQLEQHLTQYAAPFYKPTTQKAFGLTMQTEKSLAAKTARESAGEEKVLTEEEQAVRREAMRTEEGGRGVQKTLPGIEPIATERATPANFMKFLAGNEVAKLRRNVEVEKAKDAAAIRAAAAEIRKDQAKYEALKTKHEVETGKLREAIADITELERNDAIYAAEQKLNESIKQAEQDYMQGMEILGPAINQAQRELARVEPNVTVAADRKQAAILRDWLNQAYDLRDRFAGRVEALRNSRVEIDEHKVRRDAILSDYIQNRKKKLDKLEAEIKNKPLSPVAKKHADERARLGVAEAKLKERNEANGKLRREREQAALEFDNATKSYGQKVETAMAWDPNLGEFVEAIGKKGELVKRKVVSGAPKSAETKAEEVKAAQKESAAERIASKKANLERVLGGGAMTADRVASGLDEVAKKLRSKKTPKEDRKTLLKRQKDLKEYEKLLKVGRQVVRIAERQPPKRGELRAARQERTEPQEKVQTRAEIMAEAVKERNKQLGNEYNSIVGRIEDRWGGEVLEDIGDLGYAIMDKVNNTLFRDSGASVVDSADLGAYKAQAEKAQAKMAKSGIKFKYYDSPEAAPSEIKAILAGRNVDSAKGMILPDGTIVVFGNTHSSTLDLQKTIAHEVIGHYGVEGAIGDKGIRALSEKLFATEGRIGDVARALGVADEVEGARKAAKAMGLSEQETQDMMTRELIAHTAEAKARGEGAVETVKSWIKSLVNAVRNWFASIGLDEVAKATTKEIQQLVNDAAKNYAKNEMPAYAGANGAVHFRNTAQYAAAYNPRLAALTERVVAKDKTLKDKILANATGLRFAIQFVDRFAGLEHIAKGMKDQLAAFQMMYWNRAYDTRNMLVAETASNGPRMIVDKVRKDGQVEKMLGASGASSLKDVAEEVGKSSKRIGNATAALREFGMYLTAKRAKRVGIDVAFGRNSGITQADLDEVIRTGDADAHFKKAADMYAQYNKALINFLAQSGAISKQQANELTKYNDYVGFYREKDGQIVDGEHPISIGDMTHNKFLKELIGSDQAIVDFRTSSLQNTALITDIAMRNVAMKNTAYTLKALGMAKVLDGTGPAKDNIVRFKQDGKDKYAVIDTEALSGIPADLMVKGLEGISTSLPAAIRFMQGPANLLRKGVTRMPLYAVRQVIRDSMASVMTGGVDAKPVLSSMKELASLMSGENAAEKTLQAQGFIGGQVFSATPDDMKLIMSDIAAGKDHWTTLMSKMDHLAMKSDAASRVVAYNSFIKQGMSEMEASLAALEMMNFTKRGVSPSIMAISNMIPFFNAQVQGLNVLYKAFRGTSLAAKKLDIQSKLIKRGAMMFGMSILYAAMMGDDEAYKNATPEEKYNNWFVYLPGFDEPVRVPIPFEIGYIFKALPEALWNLAATDEKASETVKAFKQMAINTIPGGSNFLLPQALKPAVEVMSNYNFFTGKPIEGGRMSGIAPGKRANEGTTELSKALGDMLDVSPIKIDYLIRGYTGGLGVALAATLNPVLASAEKPGTPEKKMSELPFIGAAFQPTDGRGIINEAYDIVERAQQAKGTVNHLIERGMIDEAKEFQKENATLIAGASAAGKFRQAMGEYAKQKRQIAGSPTLSPEEKRRTIDAIKQKEIALAKQLRTIE